MFQMKTSYVFVLFVAVAVAVADNLNNEIEGSSDSKKGYDIDWDSDCQLRLYRVRSFQGTAYIINKDKRRLRGLEKSVETRGKTNNPVFVPEQVGHLNWPEMLIDLKPNMHLDR